MNDFWTAFAAIAAALTLIGGSYAFGLRAGRAQAMLELNSERQRLRFSEIYAPLLGMFTKCHITTATGFGSPYLRQRIGNSWLHFTDFQVSKGIAALFDKEPLGVFGEVEFGEPFPLRQITNYLMGKEKFADRRLIILVSRANRARYESPKLANELTDEDLELYNHISTQHQSLAKRFVEA